MKYGNYELILMENLLDLEMLKIFVIYPDEYEKLDKIRQEEIYCYCVLHANNEICRQNLIQIRHAVIKIYFGY